MSQKTGYALSQIILHWLTALGVLVAWFTHEAMEDIARAAWKAGQDPFPTVHTVAGISVFVLVVIRLVVRHRTGAPEPTGEGMQLQAAKWGHRLLYVLVFLTPLVGFVTWILGFKDMSELHEITAQGLMIVALGHAAIAIWHQYVKKDGTLMQMIRRTPKA